MKTGTLRKLLDSPVLRGAAQLSSGRVVSMGVSILGTLLIARLFEPEDYGVAALFLAVATILGAVLVGAYQRAILFPKDDPTAARLLVLALAVGSMVAVALFAALLIFATVRPDLPAELGLSKVYWLLALGAVVLAFRDAFNVVLLRQGLFAIMAVMEVLQASTIVCARILWGLTLGSSAIGLVLGQLLGLAGAFLFAVRNSRAWVRQNLAGFSWHELPVLAREFRDYPLFRLPAQFAFVAGNHLPVIALGLVFEPAVVGFFAMAHRVAALPLQAASQSLAEAILKGSLSRRYQNQPIGPGIRKAALALLATGLPAFSAMFVIGGEVTTWVLGERWTNAGVMLEILAVYLFFVWLASPFLAVLETLRRNRIQLALHWTNAVVTAATFWACHLAGLDVLSTLWVFVAVSCGYQSAVMLIGAASVRKHDGKASMLARPAES